MLAPTIRMPFTEETARCQRVGMRSSASYADAPLGGQWSNAGSGKTPTPHLAGPATVCEKFRQLGIPTVGMKSEFRESRWLAQGSGEREVQVVS